MALGNVHLKRSIGLSGKSVLKWHGKKVEEQLYARLVRNLREATDKYHSEVQRIFKQQPWGSRPVSGGSLRKAFKSSPSGGPPYKQTSNLANSIVFSIKTGSRNSFFNGRQLRGRTSTEVKYAQNIELGSGKTGTVRITQTQKIHTAIRLVNPLSRRKALSLYIRPRPVWIPILVRLTPKLLKILAK